MRFSSMLILNSTHSLYHQRVTGQIWVPDCVCRVPTTGPLIPSIRRHLTVSENGLLAHPTKCSIPSAFFFFLGNMNVAMLEPDVSKQ